MHKIIRVLAALPALLFIVTGIQWLVQPASAAATIGMPVLDGIARSSEIGDLGAFFLGGGSMALIGVITLQRTWFLCSAMLVAFAALGRTIAWLVHDAALPLGMLGPEIVITAILLIAAFTIAKQPA